MMNNWSKEESLEYLRTKIKEVKTAMLTTFNQDKGLHSRPMGTADVDDKGNIWFFTNEYSEKAQEVSLQNRVSVTYTDTHNHIYLSLLGEASLVDDQHKMKELWNPFVKAFFPDGLNDPKLTLIRVAITDAEYWDSNSSSVIVLFNMLKAVVTNTQYDEGKHGKIAL